MFVIKMLKIAATMILGAIALLFCLRLWQAYVLAPWTRDGRVSAQVIRIAPEVSGQVEQLPVHDNQWVAKGDLLYRIAPREYQLVEQKRAAELAEAQSVLERRRAQLERRRRLEDAVAREDIENAGRDLTVARARLDAARSALAQAQLDVRRTVIRSPVEGYVNQLRLQAGDYAVAGQTNLYVVDSRSFWVTAYFEETKLPNVHIGAPVSIKVMGFAPLLRGHVASMGRGIADDNEARSESGLPQVSPTFSWIRLAQRVPVRIELDTIPDGVELAAGMTASIEVEEGDTRWKLIQWLQAVM